MSTSYKTPAYFSGFSCLGGECEDTCCRNWEVKLDREHFELLNKAMSGNEHDKSMFEQYIHLNENSISSDHDYAFIRMGVNGYCAMLDSEGLCSIHAKYGVTPLGNVCTMFPRVISRCANTLELSGALSCPEVVRNCIDDETPLKLTRFKASELPRSKNYPILRELSTLDEDYYSENFELVRKHMLQVMANEEDNFETRLYVLANLAHHISSFYHRDCDKLSENQLEKSLLALTGREHTSNLDTFIKDYDATPTFSMIVVHSVLSIKLQQAHTENISQVYQKIIDALKLRDGNHADVLALQLKNIQVSINNDVHKTIDKALTRYIINCIYREWFVSMPDPFTYIQMLLVRTAILRTLIYLDLGHGNNFEKSHVYERIVYIMYNFARNIDQNLEFLKVVYNALSEQTMMTFDFSPVFIRIY